jgi:hypothetical protein
VFDIQAIPRGLLAALGAQSTGANPRQLGGVVAPTIDLLDFYGRPENLGATNAAAAAIGDSASLPVPAGEVWYVKHVGVRLIGSGIGTVMFALGGIQTQASLLVQPICVSPNITTGVAAEQNAAAGALNELLAPGATIVAVLLRGAAVGTVSLSVVASIYRFSAV